MICLKIQLEITLKNAKRPLCWMCVAQRLLFLSYYQKAHLNLQMFGTNSLSLLALIEKRHLNKCPKREYLIPERLQRTDVEISLKSFLICTWPRGGRGYSTNIWVDVSLRGYETLTLFRTRQNP